MIALLSRHRAARHGVTLAVARDAHNQAIALDYLAGRFGAGSKRGEAIRRASDACHEIQKYCAGYGWVDECSPIMADYFSAFEELGRQGIGGLELAKALQVALANREANLPAASSAGDMVRLLRLLPGPLIKSVGTLPAGTFKRNAGGSTRRPKQRGAKRHAPAK